MVTLGLGLVLLVVATLLVASHVRAWRLADHGGQGEAELEFQSRRFRRRLQASLLLGVIGLLILGDVALERYFREDLLRLLYWCGVLVLLLWLVLLAGGDWLASRAYYHRQWNRLQAERTALQADVDRLRREHRERNDLSPGDSKSS
jgi:hypothetical protein